MEKFRKEFRKWAEVAEKVEGLERPPFVKVGAIYWCYLGVGIGSELVGKGETFTRPVLVMGRIDERLLFVIPVTTKAKSGGHYATVVVSGTAESAILYQGRVIDVKRIGDFIEEVPPSSMVSIQRMYLRFLKRLLSKEN